MKYRHSIYIVYLPIFLFFVTNFCTTDIYQAMLPAKEVPGFSIWRYPEEGFAAGTLVRVPSGYNPIETIDVHDIVLDDNLQPKQVLNVAKRMTDRCIHLAIDSHSICIGYEQAVRLPYNMQWVAIANMQPKQYLLSANSLMLCIDQLESIPECTVLYQLVVEDHVFCIGPSNIIVHNADVATVSTAMLCLEYVAYAHPVVALVGSTIALSTVARKAYALYRQSRHPTKITCSDDKIPEIVFLAERYYYEQRKQELIKLKDEFSVIYRGITTIKELFHPQIATFSSQFLQNTLKYHTSSSLLRIAITDELKLSDEHKMVLRTAREQELALLEQEVTELHARLVIHFNELIMQVELAYEAYQKAVSAIDNAIALWNNNLNTTTDAIASQTLEHDILEECLVLDIQQKVAELELIITYYSQCKHRQYLEQSTTIIQELNARHETITGIKQWVREQLRRIANNIKVVECYFVQRGIPTTGFKNQIKSTFNKDRNNRNTESVKKAKDDVTNICASGGPNDPKKPNTDDDRDDDEDEDKPFGTYEDAPYHHKNSKGSKSASPDNGQDALNHSISSPNLDSKRRYGVSSSGQFVVFDQTCPSLYHGHITTWDELGRIKELQKTLINSGLATKAGKAIIRKAKKLRRG